MPSDALYKSIFGDEEDPDYETLKKRRAIALALAQRQSNAQHPLTRGMEELGSGIGSLIGNFRLAQMEKAQRARDIASRTPPGQTHTVAPPQPPRPPAAPGVQPAPPPVTPAVPRPPTQVNPVQHQQTSQAVPPEVEVNEDWNVANSMDLAAPPANTDMAGRFNQSYTPTNEPIASEPQGQVMAMAPDPVVNPPVDPRAPVPGPGWPPAPPAEPVTDVNAFAPATSLERASAPAADPWLKFSAGLKGIESGGARDPYRLLGAPTKGDRAYGAYQIMGKNIPKWSEDALGRPVSKAEFLASDKIQDEVARHRFMSYVNKYGTEGAAKAWYAGEKGMKNPNATDVHGRLTTTTYGQDFMRRVGGDGGTAVAGGATPYRNVAVQPDPRMEVAETLMDPQRIAMQAPEDLQAVQTAQAPDSEAGTRQMIAEVLANQQQPGGGVQVASLGDPARSGITMPRAEPMGSLPLMQSRNQPVPPRPPPGTPGTEITPDMFNPNPSFVGGVEGPGMDVPSMEGGAPEVTPEMLDPFAIPFNQPPAPGGDTNAGAAIPVAPTPAAAPVPPEQPAPVRVAQAQLQPGIRPDMFGGVFPPPPPPPDASQGIQPAPQEVQAPSVLPSGQPIPPVSTAEYPDPGPLPDSATPKRIGPSRDQLHYHRNMNDPRLSDAERKRNEQLFQAEEQGRREIQTIEIERAKNEREKHEAKVKAREAWVLGKDERVQQEAERRLRIEKAQQDALTAPMDRKLKEIDLRIATETEPDKLEKLKIERRQAQATLDETLQRVEAGKKPPHMTFGKTLLEWNKDTKTWRDITPGMPLGGIEVTEAQAKKLQFFERSYVARRQGGDYTAMAGLMDSGAGKIPIAGNYWTSPQYQVQNSAAEAWIENVLRDVSGAVIRVEEYPQYKKQYFPQPGDRPELIAQKAERRASVERSFYDGLGTARPIADKFVADEKEKENKQAIDWARSNPSDPRAIEILKRVP